MKTLLISILLLGMSTAGFAKVPTDAQLEMAVQQLEMPRLEARLKARATAYRIYEETARQFGMHTRTAAVVPQAKGLELASLTRR
jgi:hypothetical protein